MPLLDEQAKDIDEKMGYTNEETAEQNGSVHYIDKEE